MSNAQHRSLEFIGDFDGGRPRVAEGCSESRDGVAALDGLERGENFGFRLFKVTRFGGLVSGDFYEMPTKLGANEGRGVYF